MSGGPCNTFSAPRGADRNHQYYSKPVIFASAERQTGMILLLIILILLIGAIPAWPYSRGWGYYPSGGLGLVLVIVIVLYLLRVI